MSSRRAGEDVNNLLKSEFEIKWRLQRSSIMTRFPLVVDCKIWEECPDKVRTRFARTAERPLPGIETDRCGSAWAECGLIDDGALRRSASDRGRPLPAVRHLRHVAIRAAATL